MNGCKLHLPVNSIICTINRLYPAQDKSCCQTVICNLQILFIPICVLFMIERACSRASWDKISLTTCWAILCKFHNHSILMFWKLIHPLKGVQPLRAADYGNDAEIKLLFIAKISAQVSSSGFNSALDEGSLLPYLKQIWCTFDCCLFTWWPFKFLNLEPIEMPPKSDVTTMKRPPGICTVF